MLCCAVEDDLGCDEDVTEDERRTIRIDRRGDSWDELLEWEGHDIGGLVFAEGIGVVTANGLGGNGVDADLDSFWVRLICQDIADQSVERPRDARRVMVEDGHVVTTGTSRVCLQEPGKFGYGMR